MHYELSVMDQKEDQLPGGGGGGLGERGVQAGCIPITNLGAILRNGCVREKEGGGGGGCPGPPPRIFFDKTNRVQFVHS